VLGATPAPSSSPLLPLLLLLLLLLLLARHPLPRME